MTGAPAREISLVDKLALHYRSIAMTVASSRLTFEPFFRRGDLGDRIRCRLWQRSRRLHSFDGDAGNLGGLSRATVDAVAVLEAAGYDRTLVETVGVGQDEVDIVKAADVSVVVLVLEWRRHSGDQGGHYGDRRYLRHQQVRPRRRADRKRVIALLQISEQPDEKDGWRPPIVRPSHSEQRHSRFVEAIENFAEFRRGRLVRWKSARMSPRTDHRVIARTPAARALDEAWRRAS